MRIGVVFFLDCLFRLNLDFQIATVMIAFRLGRRKLCSHVVLIKSPKSYI